MNAGDIDLQVDFAGKTFHISGTLSIENVSGSFDAFGILIAQPPVAKVIAPPNPVECGFDITLDGSASSDPDSDIIRRSWYAGDALDPGALIANAAVVTIAPQLGSFDYTFGVIDRTAKVSMSTTTVIAHDTTKPTAMPPVDVTVQCTSPSGQSIDIGMATATDACDPNPVVSSDAPATFGFGTTVVTWDATDASGNVGTATQTVTVVDNQPPTLTLTVEPTTIWPPNGELIPVHVTAVATDPCMATVPVVLVSAVATEPYSKQPVPTDAIQGVALGTADFDFEVVAERSGTATAGRRYTFTYRATNLGGLTTTESVTVLVPHDQR
jgi:hypothetical protein